MNGLIARYLLALVVLHMAAMPFSAEEIALAQIAQGEANAQFMRDRGAAAYCVAWVARNRVESGEYGSSYQEVRSDFNGSIVTDPKWRYLAVARLVIHAEEDPTFGALYVLSVQDMARLGFDAEGATLILKASAHRGLYFFKEWPQP